MKPGRKPLPPAERKARRIAATRRAALKWHHANKHRVRDRKSERAFRNRKAKLTEEHLQVLRRVDLSHPKYRWMDSHGRLHDELWETPEALLKRLQEEGKL